MAAWTSGKTMYGDVYDQSKVPSQRKAEGQPKRLDDAFNWLDKACKMDPVADVSKIEMAFKAALKAEQDGLAGLV